MKQMKRISTFAATLSLFAAASAHASSLPQMDTTWYANQLLWLAISFAALYASVSLFIAPTIKSILATRENAISDAIREAEKAKREAESTRGSSASATESSRMKAAELMAKAQAENSADATQAFAKLDRELERKASQASVVLNEAIQKATAGIDAAAQGLADAIAEKLLNQGSEATADEPKLKLAVKR